MRCGHIAARPDWIEALADLRIATSMMGSPLAASLLHAVLTDGSYRRHVEGTVYLGSIMDACFSLRVDARGMGCVVRRVREAI
ncbi:hypothetical protein [Sphingomonas sp. VNH70]|uniref:hypothetical protein n=1 Tax=Sphingomonas silueang TaxID=3156617 RepID=UPI0032B4DE50